MHRAGSLLMDRKTGEQKVIYVPHAFVALTGTIQPNVLCRALSPEYMEAGLAARLLMAMPPVKRRQWNEATVQKSVLNRYDTTITRLMALPMGGNVWEPEPIGLPMTPKAKALFIEFYNAHNAQQQAGEGGDLAAAWSKLEGYAARLALIIHCVRFVNDGRLCRHSPGTTSADAGANRFTVGGCTTAPSDCLPFNSVYRASPTGSRGFTMGRCTFWFAELIPATAS